RSRVAVGVVRRHPPHRLLGVEPGPGSGARGRPDPRLARIPAPLKGTRALMTISRRFFLKSSGLALVAFGAAPKALVRSVYAADGGRRKKTLVVVFQRGAMDGLNVVAPYADPVYRRFRPTSGLPAPHARRPEAAPDLDRD